MKKNSFNATDPTRISPVSFSVLLLLIILSLDDVQAVRVDINAGQII